MNQVAIEMSDVGKRFGTHWVLRRVDLSVRRGEAIALFGGNGAGKSTLLKLIASLLSPSCGSLKTSGNMRFFAHEKQLYSLLTVFENLRLVAQLTTKRVQVPFGCVDEALDRLQIRKIRDQRIGQLSEGQKKRVTLAKLLIGADDSEIFLMDEPYPTLDEEGKKVLDGLLREWREKGKTLLIASHERERTLPHVDRVLSIEGGRILS